MAVPFGGHCDVCVANWICSILHGEVIKIELSDTSGAWSRALKLKTVEMGRQGKQGKQETGKEKTETEMSFKYVM